MCVSHVLLCLPPSRTCRFCLSHSADLLRWQGRVKEMCVQGICIPPQSVHTVSLRYRRRKRDTVNSRPSYSKLGDRQGKLVLWPEVSLSLSLKCPIFPIYIFSILDTSPSVRFPLYTSSQFWTPPQVSDCPYIHLLNFGHDILGLLGSLL